MNDLKILAMYLPQFHRIPENDAWWGDGFTEWTNVKKASPLYEGHVQPRTPLNRNYYDLSDIGVLLNQMNLAKKYGIDGFCLYHYWFKGRKLLQKPAEELIKQDSIPLKFMFSWANEPWTRTWDGDKGAKTILQPQDYGTRMDWIEHYKYLSDFFRCEEYIKVDGRPALAIYYPADIQCIEEMITVWNECARHDGFKDGLFIINTHRLILNRELPMYGDAVFDFEPMATYTDRINFIAREKMVSKHKGNRNDNSNHSYEIFDYGNFCEAMTSREAFHNEKHYLGFFIGWDNSPRQGINTRLIFDGNTPEISEYYFDIQYRKSIEANNEFLFINAWNEWGEGAFLEADELYGYGYLEGIKRVKEKYQMKQSDL